MTLMQQIAKHFRDVHFGNNWTDVNLKDTVADISWEEATTKVYDLNTIATLVFHSNYYVDRVIKVLKGGPLNASDQASFELPPITSADDWQRLITKAMTDAEMFAAELETWNEAKLFDDFTDPKYGNYYRNIHGIVEHTHYHLGQIVLIKKVLRDTKANSDR